MGVEVGGGKRGAEGFFIVRGPRRRREIERGERVVSERHHTWEGEEGLDVLS